MSPSFSDCTPSLCLLLFLPLPRRLSTAANGAECIAMVMEECLLATIANMETVGEDAALGSGWKKCLLSSIMSSQKENHVLLRGHGHVHSRLCSIWM